MGVRPKPLPSSFETALSASSGGLSTNEDRDPRAL